MVLNIKASFLKTLERGTQFHKTQDYPVHIIKVCLSSDPGQNDYTISGLYISIGLSDHE